MGLRDFKEYIKNSGGLILADTSKGCGFILFKVLYFTVVWDVNTELSKSIRDTLDGVSCISICSEVEYGLKEFFMRDVLPVLESISPRGYTFSMDIDGQYCGWVREDGSIVKRRGYRKWIRP